MGFFKYSEGVDARYGIFIDESHTIIDSNLGKKFNYPSLCHREIVEEMTKVYMAL
jgi:hypothetical protein